MQLFVNGGKLDMRFNYSDLVREELLNPDTLSSVVT